MTRRSYRPCPHCTDSRTDQYLGQCDGCESPAARRVRDVRGSWGVATVCPDHEH